MLLHANMQLDQHLLLKMLSFFPVCIYDFFIKKKSNVHMWICVWVFNSLSLVQVSIFMPISCSFYYYSSVVELEIRDGETSSISFIVQDHLDILGFLFFNLKLSIVLSKSVKNCAGHWICRLFLVGLSFLQC